MHRHFWICFDCGCSSIGSTLPIRRRIPYSSQSQLSQFSALKLFDACSNNENPSFFFDPVNVSGGSAAMEAAGRRVLASFYGISKMGFSQHFVPVSWPGRRSIRSFSSSTHHKPTDPRGAVEGSLEFLEWHNGGGHFHRTACVDPTVFIGVGAIVHQNSVLGADVHIGSGSIVGPSVSIGQSTKTEYNVVLSNCSVGLSCVIHNGACIGQDGFGFFVDNEGKMMKKPQMLHVRIGDHVEIGANSCIDRGSWRDTVVGDYTKIDNLVQIGHNVAIGKCCMLCGQVGIAGSVTMGDYCTLGGRVAVKDHVTISSKVRLAANSCVTKDIPEPGDYGGFPAVPIHQWRRQSIITKQFSKIRCLKEIPSLFSK